MRDSIWGGYFPYLREARPDEVPDLKVSGRHPGFVDMLMPMSTCTVYARPGHKIPMPVVFHAEKLVNGDDIVIKDRRGATGIKVEVPTVA